MTEHTLTQMDDCFACSCGQWTVALWPADIVESKHRVHAWREADWDAIEFVLKAVEMQRPPARATTALEALARLRGR